MLIQQTVVANEKSELYFRGGVADGGKIALRAGEALSFDTYFNSFTYTKYRDYTVLRSVSYAARVSAEVEMLLKTYDGVEEKTVASSQGAGDVKVTVDITELPEGAFLYAEIIAKEDVEFISGGWYADVTPVERPRIAIGFCTYKREEYILNNLEVLKGADIPFLEKIIVVDNGNTLDKEELDGELVSVYPNYNFGGSAGFTRAIIEAKRQGFSHVILMDDDVLIFPEALMRMSVFVSILRPEHKSAHLSAAMLTASNIAVQYEKGGAWNGAYIESLNSGIDVTQREALVANLTDGDIRYGAWWCFCLPLSDVDEFGLPLPLFIKFDDVEYGIRTCSAAPILTMSGMAVAHADFDLKYSMHLEYYAVRNQLIMLASHGRLNRFSCLSRLVRISAKYLFMYRYDAAPIIIRAFSDFLSGADFIKETNAEELNRSIMAMAPPASSLSEIPEWREEIRGQYKQGRSSIARRAFAAVTLGGHIFPSFLLSSKTSFAPLTKTKADDCFLRRRTVQYQIGADSGYVLEKNSPRFFRSVTAMIKMAFRILFGYGKAARSYQRGFSELTSESFWRDYLNI